MKEFVFVTLFSLALSGPLSINDNDAHYSNEEPLTTSVEYSVKLNSDSKANNDADDASAVKDLSISSLSAIGKPFVYQSDLSNTIDANIYHTFTPLIGTTDDIDHSIYTNTASTNTKVVTTSETNGKGSPAGAPVAKDTGAGLFWLWHWWHWHDDHWEPDDIHHTTTASFTYTSVSDSRITTTTVQTSPIQVTTNTPLSYVGNAIETKVIYANMIEYVDGVPVSTNAVPITTEYVYATSSATTPLPVTITGGSNCDYAPLQSAISGISPGCMQEFIHFFMGGQQITSSCNFSPLIQAIENLRANCRTGNGANSIASAVTSLLPSGVGSAVSSDISKANSQAATNTQFFQSRISQLLTTTSPVLSSKSKILPLANTSTAKTPAANTPVANTPAANTPAANTPAANTPAANPPAANTPAANTPAANTPAANTPAANPPAANPPAANTPATSTTAANSPAANPPAANPPNPVVTQNPGDIFTNVPGILSGVAGIVSAAVPSITVTTTTDVYDGYF